MFLRKLEELITNHTPFLEICVSCHGSARAEETKLFSGTGSTFSSQPEKLAFLMIDVAEGMQKSIWTPLGSKLTESLTNRGLSMPGR